MMPAAPAQESSEPPAWQFPAPLAAQAHARPHHPALVDCAGQALTYAALAAAAGARAAWLARAGVGAGARVALPLPLTLDAVCWLQAIWWLGASAVPLPERASRQAPAAHAAERAARLRLLGAGYCLFTDDAAALPAACHGLPQPPTEEALAAALLQPPGSPSAYAPALPWRLDAPLLHLTTSGSTGAAKPVHLSVGQTFFSAMGSASRLGHLPDDVWWAALPLHHVGGLSILLRAAYLGTTVRLQPKFVAAPLQRALAGGEISLLSLVPSMLVDLLAEPPAPYPARLRAVLLGGAPTPAPLLARALARGLPAVVTWGMSEAASQVATHWPGQQPSEPGDVGPPLPFADVSRLPGGRLAVAGPLVRSADPTIAAQPAPPLQPVQATGDAGTLRADGHVLLFGRADDVFISGGENVHPAVVERCLEQHAAILEVAVVGAPHPRWGQCAVAHLVCRADQPRPATAALVAFCRARLAPALVPAQFVWHGALPRDALGKLRRGHLSGNAQPQSSPSGTSHGAT